MAGLHYVSVHAELRVPTWDAFGDGASGDPAEVANVIREALERLRWGIQIDDITVAETPAPGLPRCICPGPDTIRGDCPRHGTLGRKAAA